MATETELERLKVRLMGDGSSYMQMILEMDRATVRMEARLDQLEAANRSLTSQLQRAAAVHRSGASDTSSYSQAMDKVEKAANKTSDSMEAHAARVMAFRQAMRGWAGQVVSEVTGVVGGLGLLNKVFQGVRLAADAERMESSFKVMLGSAGAAKDLMKDLQKFAADTPLEMSDVTLFSKMLLQAHVPAEQLIDVLRSIGDVAMGDKEKMHGLTYAFAQVKTMGVLHGGELLQFQNANFNPLDELSKMTGKAMPQLRAEMEKGLITFDMVQQAFKHATTEGGTFFNGMKEASTTLGGLFSTMQDDISAFQRTLGQEVIQLFRLKEVVAAVSTAAQFLTDQFVKLPRWLKTTLFVVGGLVLALGVLGIVGPAVGAAFTMAWGAVSAAIAAVASVGWPLLLLLAAVGTVVVALVQRAGGVQAVWDAMVKGATDFWEYIKPIRQAVESLFTALVEVGATVWQAIVDGVGWASDQVMSVWGDVWAWVEQTTGLTFDSVRDTIRDAFLYAEFIVRNFGQFMEVAWAGIKYLAVVALNAILKNIFLILAGPLLLPAYLAMQVNWKDLMVSLATMTINAFGQILDMAGRFPAELAAAIATGSFSISDFVSNALLKVGAVFTGTTVDFKGITVPALDALEEQLKKEFDDKKNTLNQSWEEFRAMRLKQFAEEQPGDPDPIKKGQDDGKQYGAGLSKGISGTTAVLFNSAEALSRRLEYAERLREGRASLIGGNTPPGSVTGSTALPGGAAAAKQIDLLSKIAENTGAVAKKDALPVEPANL